MKNSVGQPPLHIPRNLVVVEDGTEKPRESDVAASLEYLNAKREQLGLSKPQVESTAG